MSLKSELQDWQIVQRGAASSPAVRKKDGDVLPT
jgi:hypothetical protein